MLIDKGVSEKFQKLFANSFNAQPHSLFRAATQFSNLGMAEIVQRMKQEAFPLGIGAEGQYRKNFFTGFHAADILFWRFAVGKMALDGNYVLVITSLVPMLLPLTINEVYPVSRTILKFRG